MGKLTHTVKGPIASFRSADKSNIESLKLRFLPKQEGSGDPSPTNIRPITGWTECNLSRAKKNIIKPYYTEETTIRGMTITPTTNGVRVRGKATAEHPIRLSSQDVRFLEAGKKYAFSLYINGDISGCKDPYLGYHTGVTYKSIKNLDSSINYSFVWTVPDAYATGPAPWFDMYIRVLEGSTVDFEIGLQMEAGENVTAFEPYVGESIPLSWSSHGVEYGGYIDPVRGKIVAEYEFLSDTWGNWGTAQDQGDGTTLRYKRFTNPVYGNGITNHYTDYCNVAKYVYANENGNPHYYIVGQSYNCRVYMPNDFSTDQVIQAIGKLITPIEYDIDPVSLQTFLDYNNFWTDMNDDTEVEYCFADRLSERKLIMDTPHIETVSDIVATFDTDLRSKLVELKAGFLPKQAGTGNPSPTNIRPITGWTGFTLKRTNKNVLDFNKYTYSNPLTLNGLTFTKYYNKDGSLAYINIKGQRNANNTFYNLNYRGSNGTMAPGHYIVFGNVPNVVEMYAFEYIPDETRILNTQSGIMDFVTHEGATKSWIRLQIVTDAYIDLNVYPVLMPYDSYLIDTINLSWTSLGEKYGGYVDLIRGKLVTTHKLFTLTGYEGIEYSTFNDSIYTGKSYKNILSDSLYGDHIFGWCSATTRSEDTGKIQTAYLRKSYDGYGLQFYSATSYWGASENTSEAFIAKLKSWTDAGTPLQIVYELATPIEYDLTLEQIKTFLGQNNIFADSNGNVEVKYWTH